MHNERIVRSHPEVALLPRLMLAMLLFGGAAGAWAAMSECQSDCEKKYKYCTTSGNMSPNACKIDYEKCRKKCAKEDDELVPG